MMLEHLSLMNHPVSMTTSDSMKTLRARESYSYKRLVYIYYCEYKNNGIIISESFQSTMKMTMNRSEFLLKGHSIQKVGTEAVFFVLNWFRKIDAVLKLF